MARVRRSRRTDKLGPDIADSYREVGVYTGKILRFFADGAAKKWPLRGSLKRASAFL